MSPLLPQFLTVYFTTTLSSTSKVKATDLYCYVLSVVPLWGYTDATRAMRFGFFNAAASFRGLVLAALPHAFTIYSTATPWPPCNLAMM